MLKKDGTVRILENRSRAEDMRSEGKSYREIGAVYGVSGSTVRKIFRDWGYEAVFIIQHPKNEKRPVFEKFSKGKKYRIDGEKLRYLESTKCASGKLHKFSDPAGHTVTFTSRQLAGVEVKEE